MLTDAQKAEHNSKKKTYGYCERNEQARQSFVEAVKQYRPEQLIYLDEAGINSNASYPYGWGAKGKRVFAKRSGKRSKRMNMIAALHHKQLKAPFMFEGSCNAQIFEYYIEHCLLYRMRPGKVIIMDNASFHQSSKVKEMIERKGCTLLPLPAYSPDLNPIEHRWFPIKHKIRQLLDKGYSLDDAMTTVLKLQCESKC